MHSQDGFAYLNFYFFVGISTGSAVATSCGELKCEHFCSTYGGRAYCSCRQGYRLVTGRYCTGEVLNAATFHTSVRDCFKNFKNSKYEDAPC